MFPCGWSNLYSKRLDKSFDFKIYRTKQSFEDKMVEVDNHTDKKWFETFMVWFHQILPHSSVLQILPDTVIRLRSSDMK